MDRASTSTRLSHGRDGHCENGPESSVDNLLTVTTELSRSIEKFMLAIVAVLYTNTSDRNTRASDESTVSSASIGVQTDEIDASAAVTKCDIHTIRRIADDLYQRLLAQDTLSRHNVRRVLVNTVLDEVRAERSDRPASTPASTEAQRKNEYCDETLDLALNYVLDGTDGQTTAQPTDTPRDRIMEVNSEFFVPMPLSPIATEQRAVEKTRSVRPDSIEQCDTTISANLKESITENQEVCNAMTESISVPTLLQLDGILAGRSTIPSPQRQSPPLSMCQQPEPSVSSSMVLTPPQHQGEAAHPQPISEQQDQCVPRQYEQLTPQKRLSDEQQWWQEPVTYEHEKAPSNDKYVSRGNRARREKSRAARSIAPCDTMRAHTRPSREHDRANHMPSSDAATDLANLQSQLAVGQSSPTHSLANPFSQLIGSDETIVSRNLEAAVQSILSSCDAANDNSGYTEAVILTNDAAVAEPIPTTSAVSTVPVAHDIPAIAAIDPMWGRSTMQMLDNTSRASVRNVSMTALTAATTRLINSGNSYRRCGLTAISSRCLISCTYERGALRRTRCTPQARPQHKTWVHIMRAMQQEFRDMHDIMCFSVVFDDNERVALIEYDGSTMSSKTAYRVYLAFSSICIVSEWTTVSPNNAYTSTLASSIVMFQGQDDVFYATCRFYDLILGIKTARRRDECTYDCDLVARYNNTMWVDCGTHTIDASVTEFNATPTVDVRKIPIGQCESFYIRRKSGPLKPRYGVQITCTDVTLTSCDDHTKYTATFRDIKFTHAQCIKRIRLCDLVDLWPFHAL